MVSRYRKNQPPGGPTDPSSEDSAKIRHMAILLEERLWDQSKDNVEQYANQTTLKTRLRELATLMMMMQNDQEPPQKRQKVSVRK